MIKNMIFKSCKKENRSVSGKQVIENNNFNHFVNYLYF